MNEMFFFFNESLQLLGDRDILWFPTALRCTTRTGPRRMKAPKEETLSLGMGNAANWVIWMETPQHSTCFILGFSWSTLLKNCQDVLILTEL
jgi:hypothetical protein